ncbi:MAG: circularly permuted type 2 ATP-grasp protein [Formivibrio sp.]|nr:circularly permuted type 2 ATP-grasp protein [Formivibrio sp.]
MTKLADFYSYPASSQHYDEMLDADHQLRPHWQALIQPLQATSPADITRGLALTRQMIAENGVTYNVYADPKGADRPWLLDPLPLALPAEEWATIEAGVIQRAGLLDALLADLYGPQQLLADGLIPAELAFGHPNFLWPCHGITLPAGHWLPVYAVDLARAADGRWWVLSDRTQTPSGAGYALENRQILSRVLPDAMARLRPPPLLDFFATLRDHLLCLAPPDEPALAVVLTPGHLNETYFEHAYIARRLGLPLVEGLDLTVRGDTVYLKTLSGLHRVHGILRRLDDDYCDPVELRGDSALGVPGLLTALRAGRVTLSNPLGTGVLESPAWHGFLPGLAQHLIGQELLLPSVASWWCGEKPAREHVLEHLDQLVLKPTYPTQHFEPVFGANMDKALREQVIERLQNRPHTLVAQERLSLSQAPTWRDDGKGLVARTLGLRVYAVATPEGYRVMPGGLARIAGEADVDVISMQRGGSSKDVWIQNWQPEKYKPSIKHLPVRHDELPSRQAENLFWLGRYTERCEDKIRLLRATFANPQGNQTDNPIQPEAEAICREFGLLPEDGHNFLDATLPYGLVANMQSLLWCGGQVRSRLSAENWHALMNVNRRFNEQISQDVDSGEILDELVLAMAGLAGFALDNMTRENSWRLLMLGRRLERLHFFASLMAKCLTEGKQLSQPVLEWLLDVGDCTITYRTRYLSIPQTSSTLDLLIRDRSNPRALAFQCHVIRMMYGEMAESLGIPVEQDLLPVLPVIDAVDLAELDGESDRAQLERERLSNQLQALAHAAGRCSDRISLKLFTHTDPPLQAILT